MSPGHLGAPGRKTGRLAAAAHVVLDIAAGADRPALRVRPRRAVDMPDLLAAMHASSRRLPGGVVRTRPAGAAAMCN
jgi:hypothetical protein